EHKQSSKERANTEEQPTIRRTKKKKLKKFPIVILIIVIILAIIVGYSVHGYKSGIEYAKDHGKTLKQHKFNGAKKNDGKIMIMVLGANKEKDGIIRTDWMMIAE